MIVSLITVSLLNNSCCSFWHLGLARDWPNSMHMEFRLLRTLFSHWLWILATYISGSRTLPLCCSWIHFSKPLLRIRWNTQFFNLETHFNIIDYTSWNILLCFNAGSRESFQKCWGKFIFCHHGGGDQLLQIFHQLWINILALNKEKYQDKNLGVKDDLNLM